MFGIIQTETAGLKQTNSNIQTPLLAFLCSHLQIKTHHVTSEFTDSPTTKMHKNKVLISSTWMFNLLTCGPSLHTIVLGIIKSLLRNKQTTGCSSMKQSTLSEESCWKYLAQRTLKPLKHKPTLKKIN